MLTTMDLIETCHRFAKSEAEELNADSVIGFFQVFRPDGAALAGLLELSLVARRREIPNL